MTAFSIDKSLGFNVTTGAISTTDSTPQEVI